MLRIIFYTIIVVLILSFFGISLESIIHSPTGEANFSYLWDLVLAGFRIVAGFFAAIFAWIGHLFNH
jgi:hypothetical protein